MNMFCTLLDVGKAVFCCLLYSQDIDEARLTEFGWPGLSGRPGHLVSSSDHPLRLVRSPGQCVRSESTGWSRRSVIWSVQTGESTGPGWLVRSPGQFVRSDRGNDQARLTRSRSPGQFRSVGPVARSVRPFRPVNRTGPVDRITIVGMGQVGLGCVCAILNQDICGTLALIDIAAKKLEGEAKDFQQGSAFHQHTQILASDTYDVSENSDMVVITAGVAQQPGESRLSLVDRNANILKKIMPEVLKYSPNATILIVSNPCDIMTAIAAKLAGPDFPQGKVFGAGTCLDTSRFQTLIAQTMDLDPKNVHGYIIGEHGDSSIPVWSSVRVGALPLLEPGEEPNETLQKIHKNVVNSAYDIISLKGYTNWAIGMSTAYICKDHLAH
ncbi:L-lactate dehydrogenase B chain [Symbiodinium microadriaticum]|uniref:L-lactate dehydrogenase n=1 Tax=Symbiodinium microadriaticum TaxID=2951 RepID=A0A1Q9EB86_SYMMI|nr:L-lactate dehydrogenase B chain [Symbiodinium microadriaticum]